MNAEAGVTSLLLSRISTTERRLRLKYAYVSIYNFNNNEKTIIFISQNLRWWRYIWIIAPSLTLPFHLLRDRSRKESFSSIRKVYAVARAGWKGSPSAGVEGKRILCSIWSCKVWGHPLKPAARADQRLLLSLKKTWRAFQNSTKSSTSARCFFSFCMTLFICNINITNNE